MCEKCLQAEHRNSEANANQPIDPARRQVLKAAAGTGMLLLLPAMPGHADDKANENWVSIGKANDFVKFQPKRVEVHGPVFYVTRLHADKLAAVSAKCTHRGCEVAFDPSLVQFICPCHGAAFDADGRNLHGTRLHPDEHLSPLLSIPVRQRGDNVELNMAALFAPAPSQDHK